MNAKTVFFFLLFLAFAGCVQQDVESTQEAFFCPEDGCAKKLVEKFRNAGQSIDVAVYSFTLDEISNSLIQAKNRGVRVRVLVDSMQAANRFSEDERLAENGIKVRLAGKDGGSMHNKFAVIDSEIVATGSFNYSRNADEKNDENLVFLYNKQTAQKFREEFEELWKGN